MKAKKKGMKAVTPTVRQAHVLVLMLAGHTLEQMTKDGTLVGTFLIGSSLHETVHCATWDSMREKGWIQFKKRRSSVVNYDRHTDEYDLTRKGRKVAKELG